MPHPVKDAAKTIVCLAGAVLRGSGKVCVGVVDAALVCSAVGALRRKKMRGVVKRSVKSAMEAVGNMVNNIIRGLDEEKKSFGEVLVCCFIVLPVMSPVFLAVGNLAFLFELGAGTLSVAGPPGAVAFARAVSRLAIVARGRRPRRRPHASPASRVAPVRPRDRVPTPPSSRHPSSSAKRSHSDASRFPRARQSRCLSWARCPSRRASRPARARSSCRARHGDAGSR